MSPETISINGFNLVSLVRNVESLSGILRAPAPRGEGVMIPGRHGRLVLPSRLFDAGSIVLPMWVVGADTTTGNDLAGDASVQSMHARIDDLVRILLMRPVLTVDHVLPDGSLRRADAELTSDPFVATRNPGSPLFGRVTVSLSIPDAFWKDSAPLTAGPYSLASAATASLTPFLGATAPMEDLVISIGPCSNPTLAQVGSSQVASMSYDGIIAAGRKLVVDTQLWTVTGTIDAGGTWIPTISALRFGPANRFFGLAPDPDNLAPVVRLTNTSASTVVLTIVGRRKFMTG